MTEILVTGATGLVGNNVVRQLVAKGIPVRCLVRPGRDLRPLGDLDLAILDGDLTTASLSVLRQAVAGVSCIVHAAADTHIGHRHRERQFAVNVFATQRLGQAALDAGAKLVFVSSVDALPAGRRDQPATEHTVGPPKTACGYVDSKRAAETEILQLARAGLHAVIVNPGFMLGPWDWKPSSGRMLLTVAKRFTPFAPTGGFSVCDVRDVAAAIITASVRGQAGSRYILAGHNIRYIDAWRTFARIANGRGPICPAGPIMRFIGGRWGDLRAELSGFEGDVNSAAIRMSELFHYYDSSHAVRELDYRIRPIDETVTDAWNWFREFGYC